MLVAISETASRTKTEVLSPDPVNAGQVISVSYSFIESRSECHLTEILGRGLICGNVMSGLVDLLTSQLSGGMLEQIGGQIGADKEQTASAVSAAIPALIGGLAKNALSSPDGAASLANALERDHDGSLLDNLPGLLGSLGGSSSGGGGLGGLLGAATSMLGAGSSKTVDGGAILGHILGGKKTAVESGISQASGLDAKKVAALLPILAPLVMGALGKMKKENNLDAGGLAGMLGQEKATLQQSSPALGGLMGMLDADNDGSVMDDLVKMGGKGILGKLFK